MYINSLSAPGLAGSIWSAASRTLTTLNTAMSNGITVGQQVAAGSHVDFLSPYSTQMNLGNVTITAGSANSCDTGLYSGSFFKGISVAAGATTFIPVVIPAAPATFRLVNNDVSFPVFYCLAVAYIF